MKLLEIAARKVLTRQRVAAIGNIVVVPTQEEHDGGEELLFRVREIHPMPPSNHSISEQGELVGIVTRDTAIQFYIGEHLVHAVDKLVTLTSDSKSAKKMTINALL